MTTIGGRHHALPDLLADLVHRDRRVRSLVDVDAQQHPHGDVSFHLEGIAGSAGGHTSVGAMPRS
jgi:hypothetical protein